MQLEAFDAEALRRPGVRSVAVQVFSSVGGQERVQQVTLDTVKGELSRTIDFAQPVDSLDYEYEIKWRLKGNQTLTSGRQKTSQERPVPGRAAGGVRTMRSAKRKLFSRNAVPALGLALATAALAQTGQAPSQQATPPAQQAAPPAQAQARPPAQAGAEQEEPIPFPFGAVEDKAAVKAAAEALVPIVEASNVASKQHAACYLKKLAMGSDDRLIEWTVLCPSDSDDRTSGVCSSTAFPESQDLAAQLTASGNVDTVDATHHFLSRLSAYAMNLDRGRRGWRQRLPRSRASSTGSRGACRWRAAASPSWRRVRPASTEHSRTTRCSISGSRGDPRIPAASTRVAPPSPAR